MIQWWQILLLTLYSAYQICDELTIVSSAGSPVFAGFITGLVMGDLKTGLFIGGSLQLVVLGVGTFGGASRIDATSGAVLATAFSVAKGLDPELAISTIAVPVAGLLTYADILGRFTTTYFAHRVDAAVERFDYKGIERNYLLGAIPWAASRAVPVLLALAFGGGLVETMVTTIELPQYKWIAAGLTLAARMLPGLGFAILLHYLPLKRNLHYLGMGFAITAMMTIVFGGLSTLSGAVGTLAGAYDESAEAAIGFSSSAFDKGLPMVAIAVIGIGLAVLHYKNGQNVTVVAAPTNAESGEIEDDEI
ncbi:PTS fructose transporter subunit IIC [Streptococcus cuniculi]|uniref:PTS fructose transporter subunit IIC n=1 Tax=Streptococcus cuniculi TaxID=1432788 RepID=A0A1Q8EB40_9STRE|nr:PTS mannose/fructose/sorbose/N-acetylgalactosamine transporter subunit IIC [Streptococcus cuniculi]OLF49004.1 PTS fructose transporter subunit IIC [Streptococcus cuniculi]